MKKNKVLKIVLIVLGALAYIISKFGYSMAPLAVGICMSSTLEQRFQQTMIMLRGDFSNIVRFPISCVILGAALLLLLLPLLKPVRRYLKHSKED